MRPSFAATLVLSVMSACSVPSQSTALAAPPAEKRAVLVELYTSEGCSSCPPADEALRELAKEPSVGGAEIIAMELHVDYWDSLGWPDPAGKAAFSKRQRDYAQAFGERGVYTPQLVVDGEKGLVGSRKQAAREAITEAAKAKKAKITLGREKSEAGDRLRIEVSELPATNEQATVYLAVTEEGLSTAVPRGENAGRTLVHGAVTRELRTIGTIEAGARATSIEASVAAMPGAPRDKLRAIVFVQQDKTMRVLGASALSLK